MEGWSERSGGLRRGVECGGGGVEGRTGGGGGGWRVGCGWSYFRALVEGSPLYVAPQRPQRLYVEPLTPGEVNFTWRKGGWVPISIRSVVKPRPAYAG